MLGTRSQLGWLAPCLKVPMVVVLSFFPFSDFLFFLIYAIVAGLPLLQPQDFLGGLPLLPISLLRIVFGAPLSFYSMEFLAGLLLLLFPVP